MRQLTCCIFFVLIYLNNKSESYILNSNISDDSLTNFSNHGRQRFEGIELLQKATCDCGDAECELDTEGKKKVCECTLKQKKDSSGRCIACDCGDAECQLDDEEKKKECECTEKQKKDISGRCIEKKGCEEIGKVKCKSQDKYLSCVDDESKSGGYRCECEMDYKLSEKKCIKKKGCEEIGNEKCKSEDAHKYCEDDITWWNFDGFKCKCEADYKLFGKNCIKKAGCDEIGNETCKSEDENKKCVDDSTKPDGYRCQCKIGYKLAGKKCITRKSPSYKCDFEDGKVCDFLQNDERKNWEIGRGKIKSIDTGPSVDHTLGNAKGSYLYVDTRKMKFNKVRLQTIALHEDYCVRFFYHMYGADIGVLSVFAKSENDTDNVAYFVKKNTQGDRWKEAMFSVARTTRMRLFGFKIVFEVLGGYGSGVLGDIALDDIKLTPSKCRDTQRDAFQLCSFDDYHCSYAWRRYGKLEWEWKTASRTNSFFPMKPYLDHTLGTERGGYWFYSDSGTTNNAVQTASLNSPIYSKPEKSLNCLHFYVYMDIAETNGWTEMFYGKLKQNYVQVYLNYPISKGARQHIITKDKNTTKLKEWNYIEAKAEINNRFQLQFVAGLQTPVNAILAVDDIKLYPGRCHDAGSCNFEQDKCSWKDAEGDYSWIRMTPNSRDNEEIGPPRDHTLKSHLGSYLVLSSKNKSAGAVANLESEFFSSGKHVLCLRFYYFMYGNNLGTLKVIQKESNISQTMLWSLTGPQNYAWMKGVAVIRERYVDTQIIFRGITGKGKNAFLALDDIRIRSGEHCSLTPLNADPRYEVDECANNACPSPSTICVKRDIGGFYCQCAPWYKPKKRYNYFSDEECTIDLCWNNPCPKNSTICVQLEEQDYFCLCRNGYKLKENMKKVSNKEACIADCVPDCVYGKYEESYGHMECRCDDGYEGPACDKMKWIKRYDSIFLIVAGVFCFFCILISLITLVVVFRKFKRIKQ